MVGAAIQAASAPAAPLLMACTMLSTPLTLLALLALTLLVLAAGWASLSLWASRVGSPDAHPKAATTPHAAVTQGVAAAPGTIQSSKS